MAPDHTEPAIEPESRQSLLRVAAVHDELAARVLAGVLESRGVPTAVFGESMAAIVGPSAAQATISVRAVDHPLATEILQQIALGLDADLSTCRRCGYHLEGLDKAETCPECGHDLEPQPTDRPEHCLGCHHDLMGLGEISRCPECGLELDAVGSARTRFTLVPDPGKPPAFVALVSWIGWLILGLVGLAALIAIVPITLGVIALVRRLLP